MNLFKLVGSIYIDSDKANESLSKTGDKAEKTGGKLGKIIGTAGKVGLAVGTAAAAGAAAMVGLAEKSAEAADTIDKGSKRMNISTDSYQELKYAAERCGVEMSSLEKAAKKLEGTDLNLDDAMEQIMALGTEEERSAKAAELFGDTVAYQMSPLLAESGASFDEMKQKANDLGLVMSEDSVAAGVKLGDTMADVKESFGMVATQIGAQLLPVIQSVLDWVIEHMPEIQATLQTVFDFISVVVSAIVQFASEYIIPVIAKIIEVVKEMWPVFEEIFGDIKSVVESVFGFIHDLWTDTLLPTFEAISDTVDTIRTAFENAFQGIYDFISEVFVGIVDFVKAPVNEVIGIINGVLEWVNGISLDVPEWAGGGHIGFDFDYIPYLAKGGNIVQEGAAVVGEAGAELIDLPAGARVTPLSGSTGTSLENKLDQLISVVSGIVGSMDNMGVYINGSALVGQISTEMDRSLGVMQKRKARGI